MEKLAGALAPLAGAENFHKLLDNLKRGRGHQFLYGLGGSQKPYLAAGLWSATGRTCLYIAADLTEANNVYDDLVTFLPPERSLLPPLGSSPMILGPEPEWGPAPPGAGAAPGGRRADCYHHTSP